MSLFELIKTLSELPGPAGQEGAVQDAVEALWQAAGATTSRTRIGNLLADARFSAAIVVEIGIVGDIPGVPEQAMPTP